MSREPGVPLGRYRDLGPGVGVEFICLDCQNLWEVPLETVIARLAQRGVGGAQTGIKDVAALAERPCSRCGSRRLDTRPAFPAAPHTPGGPR
jgi:hypothetical protein